MKKKCWLAFHNIVDSQWTHHIILSYLFAILKRGLQLVICYHIFIFITLLRLYKRDFTIQDYAKILHVYLENNVGWLLKRKHFFSYLIGHYPVARFGQVSLADAYSLRQRYLSKPLARDQSIMSSTQAMIP